MAGSTRGRPFLLASVMVNDCKIRCCMPAAHWLSVVAPLTWHGTHVGTGATVTLLCAPRQAQQPTRGSWEQQHHTSEPASQPQHTAQRQRLPPWFRAPDPGRQPGWPGSSNTALAAGGGCAAQAAQMEHQHVSLQSGRSRRANRSEWCRVAVGPCLPSLIWLHTHANRHAEEVAQRGSKVVLAAQGGSQPPQPITVGQK